MARKITMQVIAEHLGLSTYAVSRALSGKSGVSPETRELIMKTAGQLGYFKSKPQVGRIPLQIKKSPPHWTGTILVLFQNIRFQNVDSLYWGPVFDGITSSLTKKKINILTLTEPDGETMFSMLNTDAIMGIITIGAISTPVLMEIKRLAIPLVMVDHKDISIECDTVFTDNWQAMQDIVFELHRTGYTNYQFVGSIKDAYSFYVRWAAFDFTLRECGINHHQIPSLIDHVHDEFDETIREAFDNHPLPEIFVCANDSYVDYTIEMFEKNGIDIKGKCDFTGFDNISTKPIKATVAVDKELLGRRAVDQMLWRIEHPSSNCEQLLIQSEVIFHR